MSFKKIGWFTTARDKAALDLLIEVYEHIKKGLIKASIAYVFVSKGPEEGIWARELILKAKKDMNLPVVYFSARNFLPELRARDKETWRKLYHREILDLLPEEVDFGVLAGYMWITSEEFCETLNLINLHPALPGGPKGSWEEVIWQLISARAFETGAMIHKVTPELDEGPALTYFRLNLRSENFIPLWEETEKKLLSLGLTELKKREGNQNLLFLKIREEELKRELPLLVYTIKYLVEERIKFLPEEPLDLTEEIEAYLTFSFKKD